MTFFSILAVCGMVLGGWYGWAYAKQTIWLNREHLTVYHPTEASKPERSTKEGGRASGSTNPQKQEGRPAVIKRRTATSTSDAAKLIAARAPVVHLWDPVPKTERKLPPSPFRAFT